MTNNLSAASFSLNYKQLNRQKTFTEINVKP